MIRCREGEQLSLFLLDLESVRPLWTSFRVRKIVQ